MSFRRHMLPQSRYRRGKAGIARHGITAGKYGSHTATTSGTTESRDGDPIGPPKVVSGRSSIEGSRDLRSGAARNPSSDHNFSHKQR